MFELTTPQQNIWNMQRFYAGTSISNICGAVFFENVCDEQLLGSAINRLIEAQSGMRLRFREEDGRPVQYVAAFERESFPTKRFETRAAFERYAESFAVCPFDLIDQPMYRFVIFTAAGQSGILLCANHLIADAWSISLMAQAIWAHYEAALKGETPNVREGGYQPFIESEEKYLRSVRYEKDRAYWEAQYPECPKLTSIKPGSRPSVKPDARRYTTRMTAALSAALDRFCGETGISQAVVFETAVMAYLARVNPEEQNITIGVPVLNRSCAAEKQAVGMFISTTPLRVAFDGEATMEALCRRVAASQFTLFRHQRFPYSELLRQIRSRFDFAGSLFDVSVSFQNARTQSGVTTQWFSNGCCEVGLEFHVDNRDSADAYTLSIDYQTELFSQDAEVRLLTGRILFVVEQIIADASLRLNALSILPRDERRMVTGAFNQTRVPFGQAQCIHTLFGEQAKSSPEQIAVICGKTRLTYRELDGMSNALARLLQGRGIGRGDIVPIAARRSHLIPVAMLAIMKAGAAYMPTDPSYPKERLAHMFKDAGAKVALTLGDTNVTDMATVNLGALALDPQAEPVKCASKPSDLCYVIFTSGSTGVPKGTVICHENICNTLMWRNRVDRRGVVLNITNVTTDTFTEDILCALLSGRTFEFIADNQNLDHMAQRVCAYGGDVDIMATPTILKSLFLHLPQDVQVETVTVVGEKMNRQAYELISQKAKRLINEYGPSECSVCATYCPVQSDGDSIGRPVANTQIYILDAQDVPLPVGVAGELCIAGAGVGLGYLNRAELTRERFVRNPFANEQNGHGHTMYHTGDLAAWAADGTIDYIGRIDTQVKIRGLRVELGEIESVMGVFPGLEAVAVTDKQDAQGRQYLVGYYVSEQDADERALRQHLALKLPRYMIPNYFMRLEVIPVTGSGKTDRRHLPVPEFTKEQSAYARPETPQEAVLCEILARLFETDRVGATEDFFENGGDSLRAIEYVAWAHHEGITFTLQNVFDYPTVRQLCGFLRGERRQAIRYDEAAFDKYRALLDRNAIDEACVPVRSALGNVFLTGATGFLGSHLLDRLMKEEDGKIYCLVRGGQKRLSDSLKHYFGDVYEAELGGRIIAVEGDITRAQLSDGMPEDVQTVIHAAATVKHYGTYDHFRDVNVQGTVHVLDYARRVKARMIHISTLSISGNSLSDAFEVYRKEEETEFDETCLYMGQPLENVYIRSKFEAECAVLDAMLAGLDAKIIRVGNLTNRASDYRFQKNYASNAFLMRMKAGLELGCLPEYLDSLYVEFSPVDETADGVVKIAQYAQRQTVFHLNNDRNVYFDRLVEILTGMGIRMEMVSGEAFSQTLKKLAGDEATSYMYEAFQGDMDASGKLVYDTNIRLMNAFTLGFMRKLGFAWTQIDEGYIRGYVEYFRRAGYLEV